MRGSRLVIGRRNALVADPVGPAHVIKTILDEDLAAVSDQRRNRSKKKLTRLAYDAKRIRMQCIEGAGAEGGRLKSP